MNTSTGPRLVLFVIAAWAAMLGPVAVNADTVRVGAILSLSGNTASGQDIRDGLLLAVDEVNKRGGVNGNRIDITIEDCKGDPRAAVEAFNRMELAQHPLFYISQLSNVGVALGPLTDAKKVVLIGLTTTAPAFTHGRELVFQYWPTAEADMPPLLRALQDLNVKKLGIIYSNEEFGVIQQKLAAQSFSHAGGTASIQSFELGDSDFHRQIEALKDQEAIYVAAFGANLVSIVRQLRESKYGRPILMPPVGGPAIFVLPEMQGVHTAAPIIYDQRSLFPRRAAEKFTAKYQRPFNHWAASGYDSIKLIAGLLEDHVLSRQGVRDVLAAGFAYSGVFGPVWLKPGEQVIAFPMYPAQILNNALKFR